MGINKIRDYFFRDDEVEKQLAESRKIIENTSALEYLDVIKKEYEIERAKRQSFENRAGMIFTLLAAFSIFVFDKIKIYNIIILMTPKMSFLDLLEILFGITAYIAFGYTILKVIQTVDIKQYSNFDVNNITNVRMSEIKYKGVFSIAEAYREIIIQHRIVNQKNADSLKRGFVGLLITIISAILYINFNKPII